MYGFELVAENYENEISAAIDEFVLVGDQPDSDIPYEEGGDNEEMDGVSAEEARHEEARHEAPSAAGKVDKVHGASALSPARRAFPVHPGTPTHRPNVLSPERARWVRLGSPLGNKQSANKKPSQAARTFFRDSMATRMKIGKQGTRKHQRYLNEMALMPTEDCPELFSFKDFFVSERKSKFHEIFESGKKDIIRKFIQSKEDPVTLKEKKLRKQTSKFNGKSAEVDFFYSLDRKSRKVLLNFRTSEVFHSMETTIVAFIEASRTADTAWRPVAWRREDMCVAFEAGATSCLKIHGGSPFHRLLMHSVCRYYSLKSVSVDKRGKRVLHVFASPAVPLALPALPLSTMLARVVASLHQA
mmetsp:Transcript_40019/g.100816  ORF Transcript_40019/g.100816 Transcript_40019/m.100816 type:complete len:358 (-) Transcript_40019:240-1313(-)|eukprot:CAMPEP_0177648454 /NCGR_PEP_ID=MMETSP0447-20121125/10836_1 /TAXON_ID=0 /ORGANISM="Stygamoeba regulata, Strain BSH-02190019" /LENGTH=357 /DNA_ID=CAMNT_0019151095 /DNA_START=183 /DNA_END=1256 /DNA_ORIENTATION=+